MKFNILNTNTAGITKILKISFDIKMLLNPLRNNVANVLAQHPESLEVELRYGSFSKGHFKPGLSIQTFSRIQTNLAQIAPMVVTISTDQYEGDIRFSSYKDKPEEWIRKGRPIYTNDIPEYGLRLAITPEEKIAKPATFKPSLIRQKIRYSYTLGGGIARFDLTRVTSGGEVTYEAELEMLNRNAFDAFARVAELILKIVQDTVVLYTESERKVFTSYFNGLLVGHQNPDALDHGVLKQLRNLKMKDMVWGGLIANEKTGYKVSHKVDGERKLLVYAPNGIWLVHPPLSYTRLTELSFPTMTGTVLDGENVPKNKRKPHAPETRFWYIVFDALAWQGDLGTQKQPHSDRMRLAQLAADRFESPFMKVNTMSFVSFNTPKRFFEAMNEMFNQQSILAYHQDGLIITPESTEYIPKAVLAQDGKPIPWFGQKLKPGDRLVNVDLIPLKSRVTTIFADNLKWKRPEDLTIDFLVREGRKLYANQDGLPTLFVGSPSQPFSGYIQGNQPLLRDAPEDSIVEFKWQNGQLVPVVIRTNKTKPNRMEIALSIWEDISSPITREMLTGKTFAFLDYYFLRIKRGLLYTPGEETLLDLTPDARLVDKWKGYKRVVAYVGSNRKEFEPFVNSRIRLVEKWEDLVQATRDFLVSADVINVAGPLDPRGADLIRRVLSPKGRIAFLFLDGDAVEEMFHPAYTPTLSIEGLDLNGLVTLKYNSGELIEEKGKQQKREKVVFLSDLGFIMSEIHRCDTEDFLSLHEKMKGRLYSFGFLDNNSDVVPPQQPALPEMPKEETVETAQAVERRSDMVISNKPVSAPLVMTNPGLPLRRTGIGISRSRLVADRSLSSLSVIAPKDKNQPGIGEDRLEKVTITWYPDEEVYRIACIGDGSCFFHAYLKGFMESYQNDNSYAFRSDFVRGFRDDLAILLAEEDPSNPGLIFYDTVADGSYPRMAKVQEEMVVPLKDPWGEPLDYSLEGMYNLLNSSRDVGDEVYSYVSEIIGVGVYVVRGTIKDVFTHISVGENTPSVIIMGNGRHYETIGVMRNGLLQTLFDSEDPFIKAIKAKAYKK